MCNLIPYYISCTKVAAILPEEGAPTIHKFKGVVRLKYMISLYFDIYVGLCRDKSSIQRACIRVCVINFLITKA